MISITLLLKEDDYEKNLLLAKRVQKLMIKYENMCENYYALPCLGLLNCYLQDNYLG
jgi:hypothetical protein